MIADQVMAAVHARYRFRNEKQLQVLLADQLRSQFTVSREYLLRGAGRIDLLVGEGTLGGSTLGLEVKVAGTVADVHRQLARYAMSGELDELLLVTTRRSHRVLDREPLTTPSSALPLRVMSLPW